ncbi:hypothetical protein GZ998_12590 [Actinomyces sp. 594]|uniref:hypothetical protein n=1 Tax=Actinomyces sp. 594 TaxID=2057793 RepID=UPI001C581664|nr:hypothetical protein [Actinomyces sp. 594]MBW3070335.1 hypothetical protein [Actinomyces sp. 594]
MRTKSNLISDHAASVGPHTPGTPGSAGAAHVPLTPPLHSSRASRHHPVVPAGLAIATLALLAAIATGLVHGSADMISAGVIGLHVTISCAVTPWVITRAVTPTPATKETSCA